MDCQCVVVYTVISPSSTIAPVLRVQIEDTIARPSTSGCISWIRRYLKRFIRLVFVTPGAVLTIYLYNYLEWKEQLFRGYRKDSIYISIINLILSQPNFFSLEMGSIIDNRSTYPELLLLIFVHWISVLIMQSYMETWRAFTTSKGELTICVRTYDNNLQFLF